MADTTNSPGDAFAGLYDLDLVEDPGDLDLYLALAARTGGPILELGCGTGRVAVPLAAAGHEVTAVDIDPAMLEAPRGARTPPERQTAIVSIRGSRPARAELTAAGTFRLAFMP